MAGLHGSIWISVGNGNKEWLLSGRVDYSLSDTDKIFGRVKFDRGVQPTYTDSVNPVFNDQQHSAAGRRAIELHARIQP